MNVLRYAVIAYSLFVSFWFIVNLVWPDHWWPFILMNKLAFFFLIPAVPLFLVSLMTGSARTIATSVLPVLVFGYFYLPFLIPRTVDAPLEPDLRVMTYNIWNQNKDIDSLINVIEAVTPDVLAIQELMDDVRDELIDKLSTTFPHSYLSSTVRGGTTALFSRHPLSNVREVDLTIDRPAIVADVVIDEAALRIIGAHLYPSYYAYHDRPVKDMPHAIGQYIVDQQSQIAILLSLIRESGDTPIILACDCNVQRTSSSLTLINDVLTDSAESLGWQRGPLPAGATFERDLDHIDYLWHRGAVSPVGLYRSSDPGGSDHAPVFGDFVLHQTMSSR